MPPIYIRPASSATDDGIRLLRNLDSQLSWLSSIGSSGQWGSTSRSDQEDQRIIYRDKIAKSEQGWNDPWSRDWLDLAIEDTGGTKCVNDTVRLPVAGMILQGQSADYVRDVIPETDDTDPFIYLLYLLSDRTTAPYSKGAGAVLISHAKDEARSLGIKRLCLDCWRGNEDKLVKYYKRQGFTAVGDFDAEEGDQKWPGTVLEMRL